jgi:hypothetical protein
MGARRAARPRREMTLQNTLISVWRQVLVDGRSEVLLGRQMYPIGFTRAKRLRTVAFPHGRSRLFGIEQNPGTRSRWAKLAGEGKRVMQFSYRGKYIANVCEGKVFRYPAWKTLKLPL